jgi:hypothetical protein
LERVVVEVEVPVVRNESVIEDEDELLYGEAAPSLFSAALESEPAKERVSTTTKVGNPQKDSFSCWCLRKPF